MRAGGGAEEVRGAGEVKSVSLSAESHSGKVAPMPTALDTAFGQVKDLVANFKANESFYLSPQFPSHNGNQIPRRFGSGSSRRDRRSASCRRCRPNRRRATRGCYTEKMTAPADPFHPNTDCLAETAAAHTNPNTTPTNSQPYRKVHNYSEQMSPPDSCRVVIHYRSWCWSLPVPNRRYRSLVLKRGRFVVLSYFKVSCPADIAASRIAATAHSEPLRNPGQRHGRAGGGERGMLNGEF